MKKKNSAVIGTYEGKCCDSTVLNNNEMKLPRELFEILFASEEYKRAMKNRYYIGFLGHPQDPGCMDFEHACIVMTDCWLTDSGEVYGKFDLIDTPVGRIVKAFMDAGVVFGISIRGAGDVGPDGEVDPETFIFRGFDLVTFPAYDDAVPVFTEIAASSDLDKQVKYKKVCAAVKNNLQSITSCEALDVIQAQFNPESKEYAQLEERKEELSEVTDEDDITAQKLEGMTQLYLEQIEANRHLQEELDSVGVELQQTKLQCSRKLKSVERITASQIADLSSELEKVNASNRTLIAANSRLKSELSATQAQNLKYTHKIEANSRTICQKDSTISSLKTQLSETVTASKGVEKRASNLGVTVENLKAKVEAAEQMVFEYQKAYANMYANALGVRLENLEISASTSVSDLRRMINGGTSTANIPAGPAVAEPIELLDDEQDVDDIVTM